VLALVCGITEIDPFLCVLRCAAYQGKLAPTLSLTYALQNGFYGGSPKSGMKPPLCFFLDGVAGLSANLLALIAPELNLYILRHKRSAGPS